jgi:hypothetical protein
MTAIAPGPEVFCPHCGKKVDCHDFVRDDYSIAEHGGKIKPQADKSLCICIYCTEFSKFEASEEGKLKLTKLTEEGFKNLPLRDQIKLVRVQMLLKQYHEENKTTSVE